MLVDALNSCAGATQAPLASSEGFRLGAGNEPHTGSGAGQWSLCETPEPYTLPVRVLGRLLAIVAALFSLGLVVGYSLATLYLFLWDVLPPDGSLSDA